MIHLFSLDHWMNEQEPGKHPLQTMNKYCRCIHFIIPINNLLFALIASMPLFIKL